MSKKPLEKEIQSTILDYLVLRGVFHWRNNSGSFGGDYTRKDGKTKRWFVRTGDVGSPDILAVVDGKIFGIEVKRPEGKQTAAQINWARRFMLAGGTYIIARSLDDIQKMGL